MQTIQDQFSPKVFSRLVHKARMEQRREAYLNPPKRVIETYVPHPAVFEKPADRKLWPDFHAKLALRCEVSVEDAVRLTSFRHGAGPNRFNQWGRHNDEKQITRRRAYRDSEAGQEARAKRDKLYRETVAAQSAAGIARMADLAKRRL